MKIKLTKNGFIYITTNLVNGKKYIGQRKYTKNWKSYLGSGVGLANAIRKYGRKNFSKEIIKDGYSQDEINYLEAYYIKLHNAVSDIMYYNIADGGKSGNSFAGKSKEEMMEIAKKIGKANAGKNPYANKSKDEILKICKKISESNIGKKFSDEHKKKISENHADFAGEKHPLYGRIAENSTMWGKRHSEETKKKMRDAKEKKMVFCVTTGIVYESIHSASRLTGIHGGNICNCCKGKSKSAGKHPETGEKLVWMYYEDWQEKEATKD